MTRKLLNIHIKAVIGKVLTLRSMIVWRVQVDSLIRNQGRNIFKFCYKHSDFILTYPGVFLSSLSLILGDKGRKLQKRKVLHYWYFTGIFSNIKSPHASVEATISGVHTDFEIMSWPNFEEKKKKRKKSLCIVECHTRRTAWIVRLRIVVQWQDMFKPTHSLTTDVL